MTKRKEKNKGDNSFRETTSENYDKVQGWPKWKRSIVISSSTASTGKFTESEACQKKKI